MYVKKSVNVLGTNYTISFVDEMQNNAMGECYGITKEIKLLNLKKQEEFKDIDEVTETIIIKISLRHEIIHAYLNESGLAESSLTPTIGGWAVNEEMVDWFALQSPKIFKTFQELGIEE